MTERTTRHRLQIATVLQQFIDTQVLPGTGVAPAKFWKGVDAIVADLAPKNIALLAEPRITLVPEGVTALYTMPMLWPNSGA